MHKLSSYLGLFSLHIFKHNILGYLMQNIPVGVLITSVCLFSSSITPN
jgi:hypothetical protein